MAGDNKSIVNILTLNVNGINRASKITKLYEFLKLEKIDIAFLQESSPSQLLINSKNALKSGISLDYYIQGEQDFRRRWCGKPLPSTISCNQVIFGF
jgi:exonuclease III